MGLRLCGRLESVSAAPARVLGLHVFPDARLEDLASGEEDGVWGWLCPEWSEARLRVEPALDFSRAMSSFRLDCRAAVDRLSGCPGSEAMCWGGGCPGVGWW